MNDIPTHDEMDIADDGYGGINFVFGFTPYFIYREPNSHNGVDFKVDDNDCGGRRIKMETPECIVQFLQYLYDTAKNKSHIEQKIGQRIVPITNTIIKILKWKDDINLHNYFNDINKWFMGIQYYKYMNKKRPKQQTLYELLFEDRIDNLHNLNMIIRITLSKYNGLPVIRENEQVYEIMKKMMWEICGDLSQNKYEDFEDFYFPKYNK